jgi:signal transduction histidine kinase
MMLTHGIVAKHQGDIWVESDLGEGSTFFIALPLVAEKAPEATPEAGSD